eukprot:9456559-Lingulodinium_polyedra.AAC.1
MAGPRPSGIAAALEEVASKLTRFLALCGGAPRPPADAGGVAGGGVEWPPQRLPRTQEPAP